MNVSCAVGDFAKKSRPILKVTMWWCCSIEFSLRKSAMCCLLSLVHNDEDFLENTAKWHKKEMTSLYNFHFQLYVPSFACYVHKNVAVYSYPVCLF